MDSLATYTHFPTTVLLTCKCHPSSISLLVDVCDRIDMRGTNSGSLSHRHNKNIDLSDDFLDDVYLLDEGGG